MHSRVISNWNTDRHMSTAAKQCSGSVCQRYGSEDPHPDPYQNVTDPELGYLICKCYPESFSICTGTKKHQSFCKPDSI